MCSSYVQSQLYWKDTFGKRRDGLLRGSIYMTFSVTRQDIVDLLIQLNCLIEVFTWTGLTKFTKYVQKWHFYAFTERVTSLWQLVKHDLPWINLYIAYINIVFYGVFYYIRWAFHHSLSVDGCIGLWLFNTSFFK